MKFVISIILFFLFSISSARALSECEGNIRYNFLTTITYSGGDKYVGEYKNNKKYVQETYIWTNGDNNE